MDNAPCMLHIVDFREKETTWILAFIKVTGWVCLKYCRYISKDGWISGMKSHDCHIFLQRLLPLAICGYLRKEVCQPLIELGSFFKELCSKTFRVGVLERLEKRLVLTLCKLEMIFPSSFFWCYDSDRWMYPFERESKICFVLDYLIFIRIFHWFMGMSYFFLGICTR